MVVPFVDGDFAHRVLRPDRPIGDLAWNAPARFRATVTTPLGLRVVTNGVDRPVDAPEGQQAVAVDADGVGDLVVVASRDWVVAERDVGGVRLRSWARARDKAAGRAVLDEGEAALRWLEAHLGRYPFTELDLVEASLVGGAGGVEFGGMALVGGFLYRDPAAGPLLSGLGVDLSGATAQLGQERAFVVAHEVAHQWAPGLVDVDAWNHPIVDEPLAQYLAWRVRTEGRPAAEAAALRKRSVDGAYAMHRMLGGRDGAADRPTSAFTSQLEYAALVYGKAPGLYFALEDAVGRPALDGALEAAFRSQAWRTVGPDAWLAALEAGGAPGAVALGQRWWHEAHGDADLGVDPAQGAGLDALLGPGGAEQLQQLLGPAGGAGLLQQLLPG
ncbi:MAG: M1 family aminopeptidase, partial [Bryobacterales bacterium]